MSPRLGLCFVLGILLAPFSTTAALTKEIPSTSVPFPKPNPQCSETEEPAKTGSATLAAIRTHKQDIDILKSVIEILAYLSALLFFFFKVKGGGYLTANLAISIKCERQNAPPEFRGTDYLSVTVTAKRGGNRNVKLLGGAVRVEVMGTHNIQREELKLMRIDYERKGVLNGDVSTVDFQRPYRKKRYKWLNMPPGDESQFACFFANVPSGRVCRVDAVIFGKSRLVKFKVSQWRATAVALPVVKTA